MTIVAGIDGCPGRWLCLTNDLEAGVIRARILDGIGDLVTLDPRPDIVLIDIPIGLTDAGARSCDLLARRLLGKPKASSVFPAPVRPTLEATSYEEACAIGEETDGRRLSRQTWGILPKICEVDAFVRSAPDMVVREVHPEVSFWAWNGGRPMVHNKKRSAGHAEREALVSLRYGQAYAMARASLPRVQYAKDDLLDAFAALGSAERLAHAEALFLPAEPPIDEFGLRMEMVF
jgi:predicted RNase H-like nuclease